MSVGDFQALAPHLVLTAFLVVALLLVSFWRDHRFIFVLTVTAFLAALAAVPFAAEAVPRAVTPLFTLDGYALYFTALFLLAGAVVTLFSYRYLEVGTDDVQEYYLLLMSATLGAISLAGASHFASFLLGLEVMSIALYVLIAYPEEGHPPLEAALKYLILSGAASTTLLFGMALIYVASGELNFSALSLTALQGSNAELFLTTGTVMLLVGVGFKLSLVPFHMWTPDVYQGAPAPVSGFLATVAKGAVLAVLLRYLLLTGAAEDGTVMTALAVVAALSMIVGNLLALSQQHIKRILAFSAIAHLGYLLVPLVAVGRTDMDLAVETTLVYLGAYFVMTLGAFGAVAVLSDPASGGEADDLSNYVGLFWQRPLLAAVLTVVLLSLAGIPLTVGFIAKFYVIAAGVEGAEWLLLGALIVGSGIGLYYYLRIVFAMTRVPDLPEAAPPRIAVAGQWTLCVLGAVLIVFGIHPEPFIDAVRQALATWTG